MISKIILVCSGLMVLSCASFSMDGENISSMEHAYRPLNTEPAPVIDNFRLDVTPQNEDEQEVRQILGENQTQQFVPLQLVQLQPAAQNNQGDLRRNIRFLVASLSAITMSSFLLVWGTEFRFGTHRR